MSATSVWNFKNCLHLLARGRATTSLAVVFGRMAVSALVISLLLLAANTVSCALECGANGPETLKPYGDINNNYMTDLKVVGECDVTTGSGQQGPLVYAFHNVNIVANGQLIFHDDYDIDFYAESILVEYKGALIAVSTQKGFLPQVSQASGVLPYQKRLTFHLWGPPTDPGIVCASNPQCGIPDPLWTANTGMAMSLMMNPPPAPTNKQKACNHITGYSQYLPGDDCFYQYEIQDQQDKQAGRMAYFGHKVLAVSFGGTLQLFGSKGVSYLMTGQQCTPSKPNTECNPAFTGTSWVRLTGVTDATHITVSSGVDWQAGDHIIVTGTDYLPSHTQEVVLAANAGGGTNLTLQSPGVETQKYNHRATTYSLASVPNNIGPQDDPNLPGLHREVDTRAAVALLSRNIQIVSGGNVPSQKFTETPGNYYGGHTIVRQGFASYQVQGVEFYQLGQGGQKGRYPVHFHMLRSVPQPPTNDDLTPEPLNYLKDCSIHDSMTRWVTVHATEGMYLARNVGYQSIGHGYYLEDATEVKNKLYSNIGVLARAAIMDKVHNPRQVPGILADNEPVAGPKNMDYMPFRSDYNHPSVFWITNGWNDFQYNFAAGAATCGACYWWIGAGVSGPSVYQTWDGYASQQIETDQPTNYRRAAITPLMNFVGNSCVGAMSSFQMNGQTGECLGMTPSGSSGLSAVQSSAPPGPVDYTDGQPFQIYYPVLSDLHNPTICVPDPETNDCSAGATGRKPCNGGDYYGTCTVTKLDHYNTSFNYAQTNFAAVWLRKGWDLFSNGAVTDVQTGGLNFITGGGYTRSDVNLGEWLLARNTVLIGHTQDPTKKPYNAFASDVGPFNADSGLGCDNSDASYCAYADGGVSFNLPIFPGQKLLNIYDGPSHQDSNAYLDITMSTIADCHASEGGTCNSSVPLARNFGVLQDKNASSCYLPNAAIAWKQPNGFYYPPAFHSVNLWFSNVDIRHFVVEPLFKTITPTYNGSLQQDETQVNDRRSVIGSSSATITADYDPFQQDQTQVNARYCTHSVNMFSATFNHIDRQTVLNDDDGTLTGLVGAFNGVMGTHPTISINEDPYFNAPLVTPECLSDINVKPPLPLPKGQPFTAGTSPYEWLSTAIIADCAINNKQCIDPSDPDLIIKWGSNCGNSSCRGVPLYREYLTTSELSSTSRPQIRMMGQATGQRSTLSLNHGAYYIDTTQNCTSQGGCPKCLQHNSTYPNICDRYDSAWSPTIFLGGHTYYVYFIYAKDTTKQKYDIYAPKSSLGELNVQPIRIDPSNGYGITPVTGNSFVTATYADPILTVNLDLTGQSDVFDKSKAAFCRPQSYCTPAGSECVCKDKNNCQDSDCAWGPSDIDCPADPNNPNLQPCFGFAFTMPAEYKAPDTPVLPSNKLFIGYTGSKNSDPYFTAGNVIFKQGKSISPNDPCVYSPVPTQ